MGVENSRHGVGVFEMGSFVREEVGIKLRQDRQWPTQDFFQKPLDNVRHKALNLRRKLTK